MKKNKMIRKDLKSKWLIFFILWVIESFMAQYFAFFNILMYSKNLISNSYTLNDNSLLNIDLVKVSKRNNICRNLI